MKTSFPLCQRWCCLQFYVYPGGQRYLPHFGAEHHGCGHRPWRRIRSWRLLGESTLEISVNIVLFFGSGTLHVLSPMSLVCLDVCILIVLSLAQSCLLLLPLLQWKEQLYNLHFLLPIIRQSPRSMGQAKSAFDSTSCAARFMLPLVMPKHNKIEILSRLMD